MKRALLLALIAAPAVAFAAEIEAETQARIAAALKAIQCEVDPANVERDGAGYELDDVFCADGQYDMTLDAALAITEKRKE